MLDDETFKRKTRKKPHKNIWKNVCLMSRVWYISFYMCSHPPFGCGWTLPGYHATIPPQISRHTGPDDVRHKRRVVYLPTYPSTSTLADDVRCDSTFRSSTCCCIQLRVRLSHVCCHCYCHHCSASYTEVYFEVVWAANFHSFIVEQQTELCFAEPLGYFLKGTTIPS